MDSPPTPPSPPRYSAAYESHKNKSKRSPSPDHRGSRRNARPETPPASSSGSWSSSRRPSRRRSGSRSPARSSRRSRSPERDGRSSRKHSSRRSERPERSRSRERNRRSRSRSRERTRPREPSRRVQQHRPPVAPFELPSEPLPVAPPILVSSPHVAPLVPAQPNAFKNDGSFMEMFKRMQEQMGQVAQPPPPAPLEEKPVAPPPLMVGKRRGGRILKTGLVAKPKVEQTAEQPKDAWSLYMAEVKKYREVCCQEEDNTRPLVK